MRDLSTLTPVQIACLTVLLLLFHFTYAVARTSAGMAVFAYCTSQLELVKLSSTEKQALENLRNKMAWQSTGYDICSFLCMATIVYLLQA